MLEATFPADEKTAARHRHPAASQAGRVAARAGAARLLLTHTLAGTSEHALVQAEAKSLTGPVEVAREGYFLEL